MIDSYSESSIFGTGAKADIKLSLISWLFDPSFFPSMCVLSFGCFRVFSRRVSPGSGNWDLSMPRRAEFQGEAPLRRRPASRKTEKREGILVLKY